MLRFSLVAALTIASVTSFAPFGGRGAGDVTHNRRNIAVSSTVPAAADSWQATLDEILDVDTACDVRREKLTSLVGKVSEISGDIGAAVGKGDVDSALEILAPRNLGYGKALKGLEAFGTQMITDIIPNFARNGPPPPPVSPQEVIETLTKQAPKLVSHTHAPLPKRKSGMVDCTATFHPCSHPTHLIS